MIIWFQLLLRWHIKACALLFFVKLLMVFSTVGSLKWCYLSTVVHNFVPPNSLFLCRADLRKHSCSHSGIYGNLVRAHRLCVMQSHWLCLDHGQWRCYRSRNQFVFRMKWSRGEYSDWSCICCCWCSYHLCLSTDHIGNLANRL